MLVVLNHFKKPVGFIATLLIFVIIFSSCDRFSRPDKIQTPEGWKEFTVNENGDSLMTTYRKNGSKKSEVYFKNGFYDGIGYTYYDNGEIQYEIKYKEGYKHGETKWFYQNGSLYRSTIYNMGKKDGVQKKYYEDGSIEAEITYQNNEPLPGLKEYKSDGSLYGHYPKVKFKEIDKLAFENKIILQVYLDPKGSKTKYYLVKLIGKDENLISLSQQTKNGRANIEYYLSPGQSVMEKVKVKVVTTTKHHNPLVIYKTYNMAAENRFN